MSKGKLSRDEVPEKLVEWLIAMGCPPHKVPSVDNFPEICRGQTYMVWCSLMEQVRPKDSIKHKRLQVFSNDIQRCQKKNAVAQPDPRVIVPKELSLCEKQTRLREREAETEAQVQQAMQELNELSDKVSSKLSHRNLSRGDVQAAKRREWFLQKLAEELRAKLKNLEEAKSIVDSLCNVEDYSDVEMQAMLDQVTSRRQNRNPPASLSVSVAPLASSSSSSIASNNEDLNVSEEQLRSLLKCGASLWPHLCEKRAALATALTTSLAAPTAHVASDTNRISPQWVVSHTAALHCQLVLDTIKNKSLTKLARNRLAITIADFNVNLSVEECEQLVDNCEYARLEARVLALRTLNEEITNRRGVFGVPGATTGQESYARKQLPIIDKAIEKKRDQLKNLITSLALTECKTHNIRERLITMFNSTHADASQLFADTDRFGGRLSIPVESVSTISRFYSMRREKHRNKKPLSMDLDTSENDSYDAAVNSQPTFIDELKIYLKKFQLEKNRKLILESGQMIWLSETLQSTISQVFSTLHQDNDLRCSLLCPSLTLSGNLQRLLLMVQQKDDMELMLKALEDGQRKKFVTVPDISSEVEEEQRTLDKIKKRLNENILILKEVAKTLDLSDENIQLWTDNTLKEYISPNRTVEGMPYKEFEQALLDGLIEIKC